MADQNKAGTPYDFYAFRYSPARQQLRQVVFGEVYDDYFGQSSWMSTADYDRAIAFLDLTPHARVLDIACGGGGPALRLARLTGCSVIGIDNNEQALASAAVLAKQLELNERVRFERYDASQPLMFADGSFDAIACLEALAHLRDRPRLFADWARVLRPGGRLVFTDQVITGPISNEEFAARTITGHILLGPPGYYEQLLPQVGLEMLRSEDMTMRMQEIARRHCAVRAARADELRREEGEEEFERQNRYREVAELLARERRLSHFMFLARKQ